MEDMCLFITAVPITKLFTWGRGETMEDMCYEILRVYYDPRPKDHPTLCVCVYYCSTYYCVCLLLQYLAPIVCVLLLQDLLQSCSRGGRRRVEDMCYERRRAEVCVDESAHHALVNAGGREIV